MLEMEGIIESIIFRNEENGYTVAVFDSDDDPITVVGVLTGAEEGKHYKLYGELIYHEKYGEQFKIERVEHALPTSEHAIIRYLSSGNFPHIGKKVAKQIVDAFGTDALEIMVNDPGALRSISGIGEKKQKAIHEAALEQKENFQVFVYLQELGLGAVSSAKIYQKYKEQTIERILENPYRLIEDIHGIGFQMADRIAMKNNILPESEFRIAAGIHYILSRAASNNGDCFLEEGESIQRVSELLGIPQEPIRHLIDGLIIRKKIVAENRESQRYLYHPSLFFAEDEVANKLAQLAVIKSESEEWDIDREIEKEEKELNIRLAKEQKEAISKALQYNVLVITGGPGTGKTTILRTLVNILEKRGQSYQLAAPTGRAAKRIESSTRTPAKTIHRLLGTKKGEEQSFGFEFDQDHPLDTDYLIVDEASMIDVVLMQSLTSAISLSTKLVLVGDVDQLPSVGPGNVLRDIIECGVVETVRLQHIYRQSDEGHLILNAHRINRGELPLVNHRDKDFFFIESPSPKMTTETIVDLVKRRLPKTYRIDPSDIQVLTPMKRSEVGVLELNRVLQQSLNPLQKEDDEISFQEVILRKKDRVMQTRNNYALERKDAFGNLEEGVYNGDLGYIQTVDSGRLSVEVLFEDQKSAVYERALFDELMHAYAITIHKSQGSEFPVVVIPIQNGPSMLLTRNLIYTAITRAKRLVVLVGRWAVLKQMIKNDRIRLRNSSLYQKIREKAKFYAGEGDNDFYIS